MNKLMPTQEQIKEFWEEKYPSTEVWGYTPIDLNNLFKYAVPKLDFGEMSFCLLVKCEWLCCLNYVGKIDRTYEGRARTPALALFWALWQVKEKE